MGSRDDSGASQADNQTQTNKRARKPANHRKPAKPEKYHRQGARAASHVPHPQRTTHPIEPDQFVTHLPRLAIPAKRQAMPATRTWYTTKYSPADHIRQLVLQHILFEGSPKSARIRIRRADSTAKLLLCAIMNATCGQHAGRLEEEGSGPDTVGTSSWSEIPDSAKRRDNND